MANDALVASLAAGLQAAERQIRDLQDIIDGIDQREQRTTALVVSVQRQVEQNVARIQATARLAELVRPEDQAAEVGTPRHHHAKPKRDRHGMHVVHGLAAFAPVAFLLHGGAFTLTFAVVRAWLKTELGKWAAAAVLFGLAGATAVGTVATVDVRANPVPHPHAIVRAHHHGRRRWQRQSPPPGPAAAPARAPVAVHHHQAADDDDAPAPSPGPSPTGSATPTPAPSASATGSGIPSPGTSPPGG